MLPVIRTDRSGRLAGWLAATVAVAAGLGIAAVPYLQVRQTRFANRPSDSPRIRLDDFEHGIWDRLVKKYVDGAGLVAYGAWKRNEADRAALLDYLDQAAFVELDLPAARTARLAFWINLYNALTVCAMLDEYPTRSILGHTGLVGYNVWRDLLVDVGGRHCSLEEIEHKILRPMGEPRIHFAIVCASAGCPPLRAEAYLAGRLDEQLDENARRFFADPCKFRIERVSPADGRTPTTTVFLSPILQWFKGDFGPCPRDRLETIADFVQADDAGLLRAGEVHIDYLPYDWNLNDQTATGDGEQETPRKDH